MKKIISYVSITLVSVLIANFAYAQTQMPVDQNGPQRLTDPVISQRLATDWTSRNSTLQSQTIDWYSSNDGYYGTYSNEDKEYMTRYDKTGNYVETLTKKEWNDKVPNELRSSYDKSSFKSQKVSSYWEVSDPNKKGYYLELHDDQGKVTRVWADDKGKFSTVPRGGTKPKN